MLDKILDAIGQSPSMSAAGAAHRRLALRRSPSRSPGW